MTVEAILAGLVRINVAASLAILLVLLLRPLVLRWLGASVAYWIWLVVLVAVAASFLPPRVRIVVVSSPEIVKATREPASPIAPPPAVSEEAFEPIAAMPSASVPALADALVVLWLLGAVALLVRSTVSTRRLAADPSIGPALVGVFRPRLVLPADFETRFDAQERALILAHEEVHRLSGHTVVNAVVEVARCANWFNPLVHLAAHRIRTDQELACDATVIAAHPSERRAYAQALLKAQLAPAFLPLGCVWTSRSGAHLRERIAMLGRASLDRRSAVAGAATIVVLSLTSGYAAWAQQPERRVTQIATPRPNSRLDAGVWRPQESAHRTPGQASRLVYRQSACRQHRSGLLRHDGHRDVVVAGHPLGWRGPRQAGVGSGLRIAQGREFRLGWHTVRGLVVAHAERRTGRLPGEARRAARCRRQGHQRRPTDRQHWRPTDRRPPG